MKSRGRTAQMTYDANGDMTKFGTQNLTYNGRHQLTVVKKGTNTKGTFTYDPVGRRTKAVDRKSVV